MTVIKENNLKSDIQPFFNCSNPNLNTIKQYSVIGDPIDSAIGVFGIATTKGVGFLGGDSNGVVALTNGNAFMCFADTFFGNLVQVGYWNTVKNPSSDRNKNNILNAVAFRNSFCYMVSQKNTLFSNTYYVGNSEKNARTPDPLASIKTNSPPTEYEKNLFSTIIIGQSLPETQPWATRGTQPLLTPDYSNQINHRKTSRTADYGYTWPLAGFAFLPAPIAKKESLMWICFQTFSFTLENETIEINESQMVVIPKAASTTSSDILSPYLWDKQSQIFSFPDYMTKPVLIHSCPPLYKCQRQWKKTMNIDEYYYLIGYEQMKDKVDIFLVRVTNPIQYVTQDGIEVWTAQGWAIANPDTVLEPLKFFKSNGEPLVITSSNKVSEIYYDAKQSLFTMLLLDDKLDLETNTYVERRVLRMIGPTVSGPFFTIPEPLVSRFPAQYSPYFDIYSIRISPFFNTVVTEKSPNEKETLRFVFHMVGQPIQLYGDLWYNGNSIYSTYFVQFYLYFDS